MAPFKALPAPVLEDDSQAPATKPPSPLDSTRARRQLAQRATNTRVEQASAKCNRVIPRGATGRRLTAFNGRVSVGGIDAAQLDR